MGLALLVWVGGGLLKRVLYFYGNEPSIGGKSPILHLAQLITYVLHIRTCIKVGKGKSVILYQTSDHQSCLHHILIRYIDLHHVNVYKRDFCRDC